MKFETLKTILHSKKDCRGDDIVKSAEGMKCTNCGETQKIYDYETVRLYWEARKL